MMEIAKVFQNGDRQVVRLPDKYRFTCKDDSTAGRLFADTDPKGQDPQQLLSYTTASELMIQYPLC